LKCEATRFILFWLAEEDIVVENDPFVSPADKPKSVGTLLGETFVQYRLRFRFWFTASACVLIPFLVLESVFGYKSLQSLGDVLHLVSVSGDTTDMVQQLSQSLGSMTMLLVISLISVLIVSPLLYGTLLHHMTQSKLHHREATLDESFSHAARRLVAVGVTNVVWWIVLGLGMGLVSALFSVALSFMGRPGVFIGIVLYFALFCALIWVIVKSAFASSTSFVEGRIAFGAVGRSFRLTKRKFWRTFGYFILLILIAGGVQIVLSLLIGLTGNVVVSTILTSIVSVFIVPFQMIGRANIYIDSVIRTDSKCE
jgi:hypothetical protein